MGTVVCLWHFRAITTTKVPYGFPQAIYTISDDFGRFAHDCTRGEVGRSSADEEDEEYESGELRIITCLP